MVNRLFAAVLHRKGKKVGWGVLFIVCAATGVSAAEISVSVDRNPVQLNESFRIVFTATEEPDGEPDFSPLNADFDILDRGQTSSISVINGAYSKTLNWNLTVMAKRAGVLAIPAVSFGRDQSRSLSLRVSESASSGSAADQAGAALFLDVEAEPKNPYVQAQVLYTVRVFRRVEITQASLSEPVAAEALVEKLGDDVAYTTERDGVRYAVTERRYAIFPQKSGKVTIPALVLTAQRVLPSGGRFDGFFARQKTRATRVTSDPIALDVRPIPESFHGAHWLPAENLTVKEHWSAVPGQLIVGEPVTRTLSLSADATTKGLLPDIAGSAALSVSSAVDTLSRYPDQPVLMEEKRNSGIHSFREEKTALIASQAGHFILPAIEIPWWNTRTDRMETARVPERRLQAIHAPGQTAAGKISPTETAASLPVASHADAPDGNRHAAASTPGYWKWASMVLALVWCLTLLAWWLSHRNRRVRNPVSPDPKAPKRRHLRDALRTACKRSDPASAKEVLLAWAALRWSGARRVNGLVAIADNCPQPLGEEIRRLSHALYGQTTADWHGERLWELFKAFEHDEGDASGAAKASLEPLFRL